MTEFGHRAAGTAPRAGAVALLALAVLFAHWLALRGAGSARREEAAASPRALVVVAAPAAAVVAPAPTPVPAPAVVGPRPPAMAAVAPHERVVRRAPTPPAAPAARLLPAPADEVPALRPTLVPPPATLHYALRRGAQSGSAELQWQHDGVRYEARFAARLDGGAPWQWTSRGGFDAAGVAPERFVVQGQRRAAAAVNFRRDAGVISFSGPTLEHALLAGAQDRLSWMLQLAAIAQARVPAAGETLRMQVAGPRGDAEEWQFEVLGDALLDDDAGPLPALQLRREPRRRHDTLIEVWLDPARHHLPVRALLSNPEDGREPLELRRLR